MNTERYRGIHLAGGEVEIKKSHTLAANQDPSTATDWYLMVRGELVPGFYTVEEAAKLRREILDVSREPLPMDSSGAFTPEDFQKARMAMEQMSREAWGIPVRQATMSADLYRDIVIMGLVDLGWTEEDAAAEADRRIAILYDEAP